MVMPRESFALPSDNHLSNNSHTWGVLERRLSDRNYKRITKSTKRDELINTTINKIIMGSTPQYYEDDIHPFEARGTIFEDPNPVAVANE